MNVSVAAHRDRHAGCAAKHMKMILIEVGAESDIVYVLFAMGRPRFSCYRSKTVIVRIFCDLRYLNTALNLVHMRLLIVVATVHPR